MPANPPDRLAYLLRDSGAALLLSVEALRIADLPVETLTFESLPELAADFSPPDADPDRLAYVIYTSGSTGEPKGAELRHSGLSNVIAWNVRAHGLRPEDRMTLIPGVGFDASLFDLWGAMTAGASLHIPPVELLSSPTELLAWLAQERITVSLLPTPLMDAVLREPMPPELNVRLFMSGGDRLVRRPPAGSRFELVNIYGPTETSIAATAATVRPEGERPPTIGELVAGARGYLLGPDLEPVPQGEPGELWIGGPGVGRGYRRRPALTAERFLPDPFGPPGDRLYRTGDLVRWLPDGELEFLGRLDHQVKVRGMRVELGEVESVLAAHPAVRESAVVARPEQGTLAAYVVLAAEISLAELRDHLSVRLPEYMVPAAWAVLDALPLNLNGKIDRRALQQMPTMSAAVAAAASAADAQPRSQLAELLTGLFAGVLGLDEAIGSEESFFHLGGHSLLATQLASRIREACGVDLGVHEVFAQPTVRELADLIEQRQGSAAAAAVFPAPSSEPAPLSFAQQRLWFLERLRPGTAVYHLAQRFDLTGELSVPALAAALAAIVRRHDALRTRFVPGPDGEQPVQAVAPADPSSNCGLTLPVIDLLGLALETGRAEAERVATAEARRPYDLERGPLWRAQLLRLSKEEHRLLLGLHHIVADAWSFGVLMRELAAFYRDPRTRELAALPAQYPQFARWQREWLLGGVAEAQLAWWRNRLAGAPAVLELPFDRPRPADPTMRGERLRLSLGEEAPFAAFGRRQGSTLFMILLAAFQALLCRWSGQEDFVVGAPVAGRDRLELEGLIGFFVNVLPLPADLSADPSFTEHLGSVRETVLGAFAHQHLPFDLLIEHLAPERDPSRAPLVQVSFALQDALVPPDLGVDATAAEIDTGACRFDFILFAERRLDGLDAIAEYSTELFDRETVQRMLGAFRVLLHGILTDPEIRVGELPLLAAEEREQVLLDWNRTAMEVPETPVHRLFERHAAGAPAALAVVCGRAALSYGELDRRANGLAWRLRRLGVGPEQVVALLLERSPELVIAALAVLKAGGAYLPIDPAYPSERVLYILRDAGARALLTTGSALSSLSGLPLSAGEVLRLDLDWEESDEAPRVEVEPESLAYVIYTSGSTGAPKGTELCHRGLSNLAAWEHRLLELSPADRLSLVAAPGFDASVWEMWPPLTAGASLHVPEKEVLLSPQALREWWQEHGLTVAFLPTPLAEGMLVELRADGADLALRALMTGGDRLSRRPAADLPFALLNAYGPTESTVAATAGWVSSKGFRAPDIGGPLANVRIYVLDRGMGPVPAGVTGEIYIAGAGLARGYLGRSELTAERFVPDPFGEAGARLYRTGDLARWVLSGRGGRLEFLGRLDHQVKIRGHRIELGEIESALCLCSEVRQATVLAHDGRLAAYVVPRDGGALEAEALRAHLAGSLPAAMVPSAWTFLDALPLTANGKVDRRALARIVPQTEARAASVPPRNDVEKALAEIWSSLLGFDELVEISVFDDFFALGGHSLLAARLPKRIHEKLGVDLPLRVIFQQPTVAGLAAAIEAELLRGGTAIVASRAEERTRAPLASSQQRLWFLYRLEPGSPAYNIPVVLRFSGPLQPACLSAALAEVVRRHAALRTTFVEPAAGADAVQVIHPACGWNLPFVDLGRLAPAVRETEAARLAAGEARRPFDLKRGPLLRTALLRLGEPEHRLLATLHHIVADGWSMGVLQWELGALYQAYAAGKPSPLPKLPLQYPDYAVRQQSWLEGDEVREQLASWRERLANAPVLELPADRPRPAVWSYRGAVEEGELPERLAAGLEQLGQRCQATPFMTLLTAFLTLLHRYTAREDLVVGTPVAGRAGADTEELIGFFVNSLALRVGLEGGPSFLELLARVRRSALAAYAHQDLPFERLVAELAQQRDLSRNPLFQVIFAFLDGWEPVAIGPGLTLYPAEGIHSGTAKFDLSFHVERAANGLRLWLEYSTDLFDGATVRRLIGHFENLLQGALAQPELPVAALPLLTEGERAQLMRQWNDSATAYPRASTIHGLFEEQVRRSPDAVAVVDQGEHLTYAELDLRAERLARRLRRLGVRADDVVGLLAERSFDLVAALLGILKAGGAYLPLDTQSPAARLAAMLADAGARTLVVQDGYESLLPPTQAAILPLRKAVSEGAVAGGLRTSVEAENLAYVMFTSGSTGRPKGVAVTHRNVVRLVCGTSFFHFGPEEVFLQLAPVSFDASTLEIWGPLLHGGRLVLFPPGPPDLRQLGETLERQGVTSLWLTAGLFHQMVESYGSQLRPVRQLAAGGDVLSPVHVRRALAGLANTTLVNGYGPTEGTTFTCCQRIGAASCASGAVPIGGPIANTRVYVLDSELRPVPVGVEGQLYAAGDGLARGYVEQPGLTAERFVPDPLSAEPGGRLYATGDRARWLPSGKVEFLGRADHQVKIRGFRIELGEIEAALAAHPEIETAAVLAREDTPGDKRLVAYVVAAPNAPATPATPATPEDTELRTFLEKRLPSYMIPSAWVFLDGLPLTANGKVDRRALPAPELSRLEAGAQRTPPRTPLEGEVAQVWTEVLGVDRIGVEDSFWALGGHSLLATRVCARLEHAFGVELPLQLLFTAPTLGGFAAALGEAILAEKDGAVEEALAELAGMTDAEIRALLDQEAAELGGIA